MVAHRTTVAGRAHYTACAARAARVICTTRSTPGSAPPRSPAPSVSTPCEFCLSRARAETASVQDEHDRVRAGREMAPRSHAFCRPSPRTPCGGVASYEARTVRYLAPGLGGGREPGQLLPRAAWAEHRRVKGAGTGIRAWRSPVDPVLPSSFSMLEHPLSSTPRYRDLEIETTVRSSA